MAKAKKKTAKKPKKRAGKYEAKLKLTGTFEQLQQELINPKVPIKKK
jgi:hypothetical protein